MNINKKLFFFSVLLNFFCLTIASEERMKEVIDLAEEISNFQEEIWSRLINVPFDIEALERDHSGFQIEKYQKKLNSLELFDKEKINRFEKISQAYNTHFPRKIRFMGDPSEYIKAVGICNNFMKIYAERYSQPDEAISRFKKQIEITKLKRELAFCRKRMDDVQPIKQAVTNILDKLKQID